MAGIILVALLSGCSDRKGTEDAPQKEKRPAAFASDGEPNPPRDLRPNGSIWTESTLRMMRMW